MNLWSIPVVIRPILSKVAVTERERSDLCPRGGDHETWRLGAYPCGLAVAVLIVGSLLAPITPAAQAELQHPRQQFLRDAQAGLFIHWGMRTSPQHTGCSAWEDDVTSGGW